MDKIKNNVRLDELNTLAAPSVAEYYLDAESVDDIVGGLAWAKEKGIRVCLLGGGSNVLLSPEISGLVISPNIRGIEVVSETDEEISVTVGAGENWHNFVKYCVKNGWYGLENLALIPGSVGAAPVQNIGAYGVELEECFTSLSAINNDKLSVEAFDKESCQFSYRDSVFKSTNTSFVITHVTFTLYKTARLKIDYPALKDALSERGKASITPLDVFEAVVEVRESKLPDPCQIPNVGSFFKNPVVSNQVLAALKDRYPNIISFPVDDHRVKLAAGWLIDHAGWKGHQEGGVGVHISQALVLTNSGKRTVNEVIALAHKIQDDIKEKFGISLEVEPRLIGP